MRRFQLLLDKVLDTFFHLPTLLAFSIVGLLLLWRIYDIGFDLGSGFVRLNSNLGNINLYWLNGCCELFW